MPVQALIKADRGVDLRHNVSGALAKPATPQLIGRAMLRLLVVHRLVTRWHPVKGVRHHFRLLFIILSAGLYASCSPEGNPEEEIASSQTMKSAKESTAFNADSDWPIFQHRTSNITFPALSFLGPNQEAVRFVEFQGKIVVLNFWATWCGPCKEEMPSLDRLQAAFSTNELVVVALSNDRKGPEVVMPFFERINVENLDPYYEEKLSVSRRMGVTGYPTTIIFDRHGREIGRVATPAQWDSPDIIEFIEKLVQP